MRLLVFRNLSVGLAIAGILTGCLYTVYSARAAVRPYLGVRFEAVVPGGEESGLTISDVNRGGPAEQAGLKKGDCIIMAGGKAMRTYVDLRTVLADCRPGDALDVKVLRDGTEQIAHVTLGEMPTSPVIAIKPPSAYLGVLSETMTPEQRKQLGVKAEHGVVVTHVVPGSPAAGVGLRRDDVITHVGAAVVSTQDQLRDAIRAAGVGSEVTLKVARATQDLDIKVRPQLMPSEMDLPRVLPELRRGQGERMGSELLQNLEHLPALERRVQELEQRVRELEQQLKK
jgi:S1-C subfamily serine protease